MRASKLIAIGDTFPVSPSYIARRIERDEADGGGEHIELGISRTDIDRLGIHRINLFRKPDEPRIERHQSLNVTVTKVSVQNWTRGRTVIVDGAAEIVQYTPKFLVRVDGISLLDRRNLKEKFGSDFPALIAADPSLLAETRYSKEKRDIISKACQREILARKGDTVDTLKIVAMLTACGVTKAKARKLTADYDPVQSPYQFFFRGGLLTS